MLPSGANGGAYGLAFAGIAPGPGGFGPAPGDWPVVTLRTKDLASVPAQFEVGEEQALVPFVETGAVLLDRPARTATFFTAKPLDEVVLVHPLSSVIAGCFSRWLGREVLHAGGFVAPDGRVWALLADRGGGKSTTLAALAFEGWPVMSDDLLVIDERSMFRGPRCIDLRQPACAALGAEGQTTPVRGDRQRLSLPEADAELPLAGFIFLEWGARLELTRLEPAKRMQLLASHRAGGFVSGQPEAALKLAELPAAEVRRPAGHEALPSTLRMIERFVRDETG